MFVFRSTFQKIQNELTKALLTIAGKDLDYQTLKDRYNDLDTRHNSLVRREMHLRQDYQVVMMRISALGGEDFLTGKVAHPYIRADLSEAKLKQNRPKVEVRGFSEADLKSLLQLVHPDKHGGKESAVRMTQLINQLRG